MDAILADSHLDTRIKRNQMYLDEGDTIRGAIVIMTNQLLLSVIMVKYIGFLCVPEVLLTMAPRNSTKARISKRSVRRERGVRKTVGNSTYDSSRKKNKMVKHDE